MAVDSFSWSPLVFGSMATEITGSGKLMDSSTIGFARVAQGVAGGGVLEADGGVDVAGGGAVNGISLLACIWNSLPMRSFLPLVELTTWAPASTDRSRRGCRSGGRRTGALQS